MLRKLSIYNYAIIAQLEINFSSGLNIITGETGAGKSILLGALSLLLGDRADSNVLLNKEKKCLVEGIFSVPDNEDVQQFFRENDLDEEDQIIIRREINTNGKSRGFINDTPVNLLQLATLSQYLADLHQQFDTLQLQQSGFQREVLDALCDHIILLQQYRNLFHQYLSQQKIYQQLKNKNQQAKKELDYIQFLHDELSAANFKENEAEQLEEELKILTHAEIVKQSLEQALDLLEGTEQPVIATLKQLINVLQSTESYHHSLPEITTRLNSAYIELQDIANEISHLNNYVSLDAERINEVNERLSLAYRLFKKHNLHTTAELLQLQNDLDQQLQNVLQLDEKIGEAEKEMNKLFVQVKQIATQISANRQKQIKPFEKKVNQLLMQVGMPNAKLKVEIAAGALHEYGHDNIEFLFDANTNGQWAALRKVASGGELSRLMLCIKSLVAASVQLPTLIFDEIDSGISGEAARQAGIILKNLSQSHQVICITHQPQIAGKANAHYFVYKEMQRGKTVANIRLLNNEERIITIAQMLSGEKPTAAALQNAREMLQGEEKA